MEDLKIKLLDLVHNHRNNNKVPIVDYENNLLPNNNSPAKSTATESTSKNCDSQKNDHISSDLDILDTIDEIYFTEDFKPARYELEKLNGSLEMDLIENNLHKLQSQLAVISKKLLHMILENQSLCEKEFNKMQELQLTVSETLTICQTARTHLNKGQKSFTTASLGILSNYRKRKIVQDLLRSLNTIKTLLQSEARLIKLLNEGNFSDAISLLLECQQVALTYKHFHCVAALSGKLQDTLVMAEEQLDVALAKICYEFDADIYGRLQAAYSQLGKRRIAMDQLHMHYTSAIHSTAFNVIHSYITVDNTAGSKKPFIQLCQQVENDSLIKCLLKLSQTFWCILRSYNQVVRWHHLNQSKINDNDFEQNINEQYIKQKLDSGLGKLWHDIQNRVSILITNSNVTRFKFDDFLQMLAILHKLVQIGEEFCGSDSQEIQISIKGQSSHYFRKYHLSRLEELRLFLENEAWHPCPVKPSFNLLHLQEFRNLRNIVQNASFKNHKRNDSLDHISSSSVSFFDKYSANETPFDVYTETDSFQFEEDILLGEDTNSDCCTEGSDDDELTSQNYGNNDNLIRKPKKNNILLTNTTLTVLRHCGKYLQMSRLLRSIASDVLICLKQLFEYYLYAVSTFFITDLQTGAFTTTSYSTQKLLAVLKRIEESLIFDEKNPENNLNKVFAPTISPTVDLINLDTLFGISERIVGVESLIFLGKQYLFLRDYLQYLIDEENDKHSLELFYSQEVSMAIEVRKPVYGSVSRQIIDSKDILNLMSRVNWEVKDVMCQHSQYVDILFRELQVFATRLENINSIIHIPLEVTQSVWLSLAEVLADVFVEGFSNAKKCSNGGRALMQLDFTQLMSKLEILSSIKPMPRRDYVETYVKAFYLPETTLETWIQRHTEYSTKQLLALVNCALYNNKKARQKLALIIEGMERR